MPLPFGLSSALFPIFLFFSFSLQPAVLKQQMGGTLQPIQQQVVFKEKKKSALGKHGCSKMVEGAIQTGSK
jgi:hypothetical protein